MNYSPHPPAVDRILATYVRACPDNPVPSGDDWYPRQRQLLEKDGIVVSSTVVAVLSVLSPGVRWESLMELFPDVLRALREGSPIPGPFYGRNKTKARHVWRVGISGIHIQSAPKTYRFALNLWGSTDCVTVDRWAFRIAGVREGTFRRYRVAEESYREAAKILGRPPAVVQSRTWEAVRDGRVPLCD